MKIAIFMSIAIIFVAVLKSDAEESYMMHKENDFWLNGANKPEQRFWKSNSIQNGYHIILDRDTGCKYLVMEFSVFQRINQYQKNSDYAATNLLTSDGKPDCSGRMR